MSNVETHHPADCEICYTNASNEQTPSLYFTDYKRPIDFVLAWRPHDDAVRKDLGFYSGDDYASRAVSQFKEYREKFEDNLINEGLELENETIDAYHFTKIHAPIEVLRKCTEILKLRMPMKKVSVQQNKSSTTAQP